MDKAELKNLIDSKTERFLKRLKHAGINHLEYWEERLENLPRELLVKYLKSIDESKKYFPEMSARESDSGKYGATGYKWVFKLKDSFLLARI